MKKLVYLLLLWVFFVSWATFAFESTGWDNIKITVPINWNYYVAWGRVSIEKNIWWDLVIAWWDLDVRADIGKDLTIAGWQVLIEWNVWDDVRAAWWDLTVEKNIWWDLVIAGGNLTVRDSSIISWWIVAAWWTIKFEWTALWNSKIAAWELSFDWIISWDLELKTEEKVFIWTNAKILWNLSYEWKEKNPELEKIVSGKIEYKKVDYKVKKDFMWFVWSYIIWKVLFLTLFASLFIVFMKKFFSSTVDILKNQTWKSFLTWLLLFASIPFIILMLFISVVWIPFGLFLLFIYIFLFVFYELISVSVFSALVINKLWGFDVVPLWKKLLIVIWFALLFALISWIDIFAAFFALWAIALKKYSIVKENI